jgi:predicted dehydrogenase
MNKKLKIAVFGAGRFGQIHMKILKNMPEFELVGFFDPAESATAVEQNSGTSRFHDPQQLMEAADVINIVSSTDSHYSLALQAIKKFKPLFIEKPVTLHLQEAKSLQDMAKEAGIKIQTGHVERFNPAFLSAFPFIQQPVYIESHRLEEFNNSKEFVDVLDDLMVHDIDILLQLVNSPIKKINASAVGIFNGSPDFVNARIEFENGCTASLNASRLAVKKMRITRVFQKDASLSINFLENKTGIIRKSGNGKEAELQFPEVKTSNAIENEWKHFHQCILTDKEPDVNMHHAIRALSVAELIKEKLKLQTDFYTNQTIS